MATARFQEADASIYELMKEVAEAHHPLLAAQGVTTHLQILIAFAKLSKEGEPQGTALSAHGVRALGIAKLGNLIDRTVRQIDAYILLDGDYFLSLGDQIDKKKAILDHELTHFEIKRDKKEEIIRDPETNRPSLKLRKHDYQFGWFASVAERYGLASVEQQQAQLLFSESGQQLMPFLQVQPTVEQAQPERRIAV